MTKMCCMALLHALGCIRNFVLRCKNLYRIGPSSMQAKQDCLRSATRSNLNMSETVKPARANAQNWQQGFSPFWIELMPPLH